MATRIFRLDLSDSAQEFFIELADFQQLHDADQVIFSLIKPHLPATASLIVRQINGPQQLLITIKSICQDHLQVMARLFKVRDVDCVIERLFSIYPLPQGAISVTKIDQPA